MLLETYQEKDQSQEKVMDSGTAGTYEHCLVEGAKTLHEHRLLLKWKTGESR